jgi:F-type H+-transporting ATPase subunit b
MNFNLTLIGQMITFAVFVWFTMTYVWTPIVKALQDRKAKIAEGLAAAERGHQEKAARGAAGPGDLLKAGQAQAAEIVSQAQRRAGEIVEEAKNDARAEGQRLVVAAQAEIERRPIGPGRSCASGSPPWRWRPPRRSSARRSTSEAHRGLVDSFAKQI